MRKTELSRVIEGITAIHGNRTERWDQASVHEFTGTYGDYLLGKVAKVFPQLRQEVLQPPAGEKEYDLK